MYIEYKMFEIYKNSCNSSAYNSYARGGEMKYLITDIAEGFKWGENTVEGGRIHALNK